MVKKVLVTGGAGFIGSHLADALIAIGHEVHIIDNLVSGQIDNVPSKGILHRLNITDKELVKVIGSIQPEIIFHHAAQIDVQKSLKQPDEDAEINILGTIRLLEAAKRSGAKKIIYASSAAVYGNPQFLPVNEEHPIQPTSAYGISKFTPEQYIRLYGSVHGLNYTILRYANVYGPRQDAMGEAGVVSIFLDKMRRGTAPAIFGGGKQTRDFIYVQDIVSANLAAMERGDGEVMNISTNTATEVNELFAMMARLVDFHLPADYLPVRDGDIVHSYLDYSKANQLLGWEPSFTLEEGLKKLVESK